MKLSSRCVFHSGTMRDILLEKTFGLRLPAGGEFLAIDIESKQSFLGKMSSEAVEKARKEHPNKVFYVVKIGHSVAETMAGLLAN